MSILLNLLKNEWVRTGIIVLVIAAIFWIMMAVRGCDHRNDVKKLVEGIKANQDSSAQLLKDTAENYTKLSEDLVEFQTKMNEDYIEAQSALTKTIRDLDEERQEKLDAANKEMSAKWEAQRTELRRYYDNLLENPETIGPAFDSWTTPDPDYWDGPTSGDYSP